ncbi:MAG TPA: saccharopine dehydrogenase NADP-binding domain-containing protein [Pseudonocardia sp.]|nr:saccharopine dehydrogenase NADP-binding domain-containing protein [Pseudonocardia sp.]
MSEGPESIAAGSPGDRGREPAYRERGAHAGPEPAGGAASSRVVAVGGAGAMGEVSTRLLAGTPGVGELVIADRDLARAHALAGAIGGPARPQELDLTDTLALRDVLDGADLVVNTAGPYYRFGVAVLQAALAAGAHYVDICDDPGPTLDMLALDEPARAAGVTALIGMGASPGVSNLLARLAADRLDAVEDILTAWPEDPVADLAGTPADSPSAATLHWVVQFSEPGPALTDGRLGDVVPLQPLPVDYPEVGSGVVWTVGHPEAVTLQRAVPGLRRSRNAMVITPAVAAELRRAAAELTAGAAVPEVAAAMVARFRTLDPAAAREGGPPFGWLFALARGRRGGAPARVAAGLTAYPPGGMAGATGVPLAIGARMLLDGTVSARGAHPPETCVPPAEFFARLAPHCGGAPSPEELVRFTAEPPESR